jgi:hypothetical protein
MVASFVGTVSSGIQDVSAILPLLGTEQCERHVGSALCGGGKGGYLYAAVTPLSIFGSLGTAKAAFGIMVSSYPLHGSRILRQMGFELKGDAAAMIAATGDRYLAESRLLALLQAHFVRSAQHLSAVPAETAPRLLGNLGISHPAFCLWNLKLLIFSLVAALLGVGPYLHFSIQHHTSSLPRSLAFPLLRVIGGLLCVFPAQLMIQHRLLVILQQRILFQRINDLVVDRHDVKLPAKWKDSFPSEEALTSLCEFLETSLAEETPFAQIVLAAMDDKIAPGNVTEKLKCHITDSWYATILRVLLLIGFLLTLVGYVGCFTIIQDSKSTPSDTYLWLGLEAFLSLVRMMVWGWNPGWDDSDGITLALTKPKDNPFRSITIHETGKSQDLDIMDETDFWEKMTAYCGLSDPSDLRKIVGFKPWYAWTSLRGENRLCLFLERNQDLFCMMDQGTDPIFYNLGKDDIKWPFERELPKEHHLMVDQTFKLAVFAHYSFIISARSSRPFHLLRTSWTLLDSS